ncbi:unnamed protein product, partial [Mesorhabditis spiculigera]
MGCPKASVYGKPPPTDCRLPTDPNNTPRSALEKWFTKEMFQDLFPFANLGLGPNPCLPYSYEAFVIAARYFPEFATVSPNKIYTPEENYRRDLAAFFAHAIQETGENNIALYGGSMTDDQAHNCFYRGGFYNWFEGGPSSSFLDPTSPGYEPKDGNYCHESGKYCAESDELTYWFPCGGRQQRDGNVTWHTGCYFGRGAIQISYNYNYGQFNEWLLSRNITVDLMAEPNLVITKMDPPLAILASLWFYMTPQPPKPAMHDIVMGTWNSGTKNAEAGYTGPIFGPTSLIINNECNGEDREEPGGPGESRRIKAFKWFCRHFGVPAGADKLLSCKNMPVWLEQIGPHPLSWQPNWTNTWKEEPCDCAPAGYGGMIPYFHPDHYPAAFVALNARNRLKCVASVYDNPSMYSMNNKSSPCLNF